MGAYGTPDTYPYEEIERKCPKCGKVSKGKFCCYCGAEMRTETIVKTNNPEGKTKKCKHCQSDIPKKAKVCPVCRKKQGGKAKWIIIVILALLFLPKGGSTQKSNYDESLTPEQFKAECMDVSYEELARNPDAHEGEKVKFTGNIMQVVYDSDTGMSKYLVSVTKGDYGFWDDNVFVELIPDNKTGKFLEDDIVTFYGIADGEYSYKTVLGKSVTVPCVEAVYMDISN